MSRKVQSLDWVCCLVVVISVAYLCAPTPSHGFDISIQVSPSTLNIQSKGEVVTIHTDIPYSSVVGGSVILNEIPISWWKADNQGNFVAKFNMDDVKELAEAGELEVPGENVLTLTGYTNDGEEFTGTETIIVIDVKPTGSGGK